VLFALSADAAAPDKMIPIEMGEADPVVNVANDLLSQCNSQLQRNQDLLKDFGVSQATVELALSEQLKTAREQGQLKESDEEQDDTLSELAMCKQRLVAITSQLSDTRHN